MKEEVRVAATFAHVLQLPQGIALQALAVLCRSSGSGPLHWSPDFFIPCKEILLSIVHAGSYKTSYPQGHSPL